MPDTDLGHDGAIRAGRPGGQVPDEGVGGAAGGEDGPDEDGGVGGVVEGGVVEGGVLPGAVVGGVVSRGVVVPGVVLRGGVVPGLVDPGRVGRGASTAGPPRSGPPPAGPLTVGVPTPGATTAARGTTGADATGPGSGPWLARRSTCGVVGSAAGLVGTPRSVIAGADTGSAAAIGPWGVGKDAVPPSTDASSGTMASEVEVPVTVWNTAVLTAAAPMRETPTTATRRRRSTGPPVSVDPEVVRTDTVLGSTRRPPVPVVPR